MCSKSREEDVPSGVMGSDKCCQEFTEKGSGKWPLDIAIRMPLTLARTVTVQAGGADPRSGWMVKSGHNTGC